MGASILLPENSVSMYRGAAKVLLLEVTKPDPADPDDPLKNVPYNLTGCTIHFSIKRTIRDTSPIVYKTNDAGVTITDAPAGKASITINAADMKNRDLGFYVFDVWLVPPAGEPSPLIEPAKLELLPGVTVL